MTWSLQAGLTGTPLGLALAILTTVAVAVLWGRLILRFNQWRLSRAKQRATP